MSWETISSVLISAVVLAAIITSAINLIIAILNGKSLRKIEKERQNNLITQYRFKELHSILQDWINISRSFDVSLDSDKKLSDEEIVNYLNEISRILKQKYDIAYSLIGKGLWKDMEKYFEELFDAKEKCYTWILGENKKCEFRKIDYEGVTDGYIECYKKTKRYFEMVINSQLQKICLNENK